MPNWNSRRTCTLIILALAFAVRLSLLFGLRSGARSQDYGEEILLARNLADNGRFANAFGDHTGPSAHEMPLFPLFAAAVIRFTSESAASSRLLPVAAAAAASIEFALLPSLAVSFGWRMWIGIFAGLAGALLPVHFWVETTGGAEAVYVGLVLAILMIPGAACIRLGAMTRKQAVGLGFLSGLSLLLSASLMPVLTGLALALLWVARDRATVGKRLALSACIAGGMFLPWIIRNAIVFHTFVPFRTNLGLELDSANRDGASPLLEANQFNGIQQAVHPLVNAEVRSEVAREGEVKFNHERMVEVRGWIIRHKGKFLALTAQRLIYFWFPILHGFLLTILSTLMAIAAFCGMFLAARTSPRSAMAVSALWLFFPIIYYFVASDSRYRYPIWWSMLLMAAYFVCEGIRRRGTSSTAQRESGVGMDVK